MTLSLWQEPPTADKEHQVAGDNAGAEDAAAGVPAARSHSSPGDQGLPAAAVRRDPHCLAKRIYTVLIGFVFKDEKEHLFTATSPRHSCILKDQQNKPWFWILL